MGVASIVLDDGGTEDEAIAALLHDAPEDQGGRARLEEIRSRFGEPVARIVEDCTDSWESPKPEWLGRKRAYAYRTRIEDVPLEQNLREDEGWIDMQVQFLIDERRAGSTDLVVGRTVLPPGARHDRHAHPDADEFLVVMSGHGEIHTNTGREPSRAGDVIFTPRGNWHGFVNTSDDDVLLIWGWSGAGSLERAGYALPDADATFSD
jgi:quercetin dioxygenase-like cupin family protein